MANIKLVPRGVRIVFEAKRYELEFPLQHPKEFIIDYDYESFSLRIIYPSKIRAFFRDQEGRFLKLLYKNTEWRKNLIDNIKRKFLKMSGV